MTSDKIADASIGLGRMPRPVQWAALVALSLAFGVGLYAIGIPAVLLLGPMAGAIVASVFGARVGVPRPAYYGAQALVGCLIASTFKPETLETVAKNWAVFFSVVAATYVASLALGYAMSRLKILPGTTAVWGSAPGAASAMMLMAEAFGADPRLVAFMQYLRVVFVALAASIVARLWVEPGIGEAHHTLRAVLDPAAIQAIPDHPLAVLKTLAFAAVGAVVGRRSGLPAGQLLVPMAVGAVLRLTGMLTLDLPPWILALSYAIVGWKIGLGFTRDVFARAARAVIPVIINVLILIAICGGFAVILVKAFGIDPLTAYLATSPGGMDSIAIIGASTNADLPFVMALHALRFTIVLTLGPSMARIVARWAERT